MKQIDLINLQQGMEKITEDLANLFVITARLRVHHEYLQDVRNINDGLVKAQTDLAKLIELVAHEEAYGIWS